MLALAIWSDKDKIILELKKNKEYKNYNFSPKKLNVIKKPSIKELII